MRTFHLLCGVAALAFVGCFEPPEPGPVDEDLAATQTIEVCEYIGGLNRIGFRGEAGGMCATLLLVETGAANPEGALTLPVGWGVESQSLVVGPCTGRAWNSPHEAERTPHGQVTLGASWQGPHELDVRFTTGTTGPSIIQLRGSGEPSASCL